MPLWTHSAALRTLCECQFLPRMGLGSAAAMHSCSHLRRLLYIYNILPKMSSGPTWGGMCVFLR
jgi:hypothetical protein